MKKKDWSRINESFHSSKANIYVIKCESMDFFVCVSYPPHFGINVFHCLLVGLLQCTQENTIRKIDFICGNLVEFRFDWDLYTYVYINQIILNVTSNCRLQKVCLLISHFNSQSVNQANQRITNRSTNSPEKKLPNTI